MAWDFEPLRESLVFLTTQYLTGLELQKPRCDEENYEIPEIAQIDELQTFVGSKKNHLGLDSCEYQTAWNSEVCHRRPLIAELGVEIDLTVYPSHSAAEPYMRISPHTAPSLTVSLLRVQHHLFIKSCFIIVTMAM
ncbi:hypothetical protein N39L_36760 [Limnospira platensis NIES-39]|nr:hypothetical protein N39L_36760 [Arthrospira platensis NIES-39]